MELCTGGSLYNLLDDPQNAFGVDEAEFLCILSDVGKSDVSAASLTDLLVITSSFSQ